MSQIDTEDILSARPRWPDGSETEAGHSDEGREMIDSLKMVPVAESIRYRKRAQSAEKKAEVLSEQLAQTRSQLTKLSEQLSDIQTEQKLVRRLAAAGAADMEAAVLIAKARLDGGTEADLESVVEQLKKEKQYLFAQAGESSTVKITKTAGARQRVTSGQAALERAAKKAATTGNRTDLQEYLKLRRNFL